MNLPSPKQMLVRSQEGHFTLLRAARDGQSVVSRTDGEARGYMTARSTLLRWDALRFDAATKTCTITERGLALLALQDQRIALAQPRRVTFAGIAA